MTRCVAAPQLARTGGHLDASSDLKYRSRSGRLARKVGRAVKLDLDRKIATRLEMVEHARDIITKAFMLKSLDPALPTMLSAIVESRGLYEYGIGEFFLLYGKF